MHPSRGAENLLPEAHVFTEPGGRKGRTISSGRPNRTQGKSIWMPSPPVVFSRGKTGLDAEALPKQATTALEADVGHKGIQTPGTLIGQGLAGGLIGDAVY